MKRRILLLLCVCLAAAAAICGIVTVGASRDTAVTPGKGSVALLSEGKTTLSAGTTALSGGKRMLGARPAFYAPPDPVNEDAKKALYDGLYALKEKIDLVDFRLTAAELQSLLGAVVNSSPELFYVCSDYTYGSIGGVVSSFMPQYTDPPADCVKKRAEYDEMLNALLDRIDPAYTDLETVVFCHEMLASEYEYDAEGKVFDAYTFLKEKKGVCQSYTLVFTALMRAKGIEVSYAESGSMKHIWNTVRVDGEWYHVDVTWDDPLPERFGGAGHTFLLRSDAAISDPALGSKRHVDFRCAGNAECTSTRFDSSPLIAAETPAVSLGGKWYFSDPNTGDILSLDLAHGSLETGAVYRVTDVWNVWDGQGQYYPKKYTSLSAAHGLLWLQTPTAILSLDPADGKTVLRYRLPASKTGYLFYTRADGDGIDCVLSKAAGEYDPSTLFRYDYPGHGEPDPTRLFHLWQDGTFLGSFDGAEDVTARMNDPASGYTLRVSFPEDGKASLGTLGAFQAKRLSVLPFDTGREGTLLLTGESTVSADLSLGDISLAGEGENARLLFNGKYLTIRNTSLLKNLTLLAGEDSTVTLHGIGPIDLSGSVECDTLLLDCSLLLGGKIKAQILGLEGDTTIEGKGGTLETEIVRGSRLLTLKGIPLLTVSDACECTVECLIETDPKDSVLFTAPEIADEDAKLYLLAEDGTRTDCTVLLSRDAEGRFTVPAPALLQTEEGKAIAFTTVGVPAFFLPEDVTALGEGSFASVPTPMLLILHGNVLSVAPDALNENVTLLVPENGASEDAAEAAGVKYTVYTEETADGAEYLLMPDEGRCVCVGLPDSDTLLLPASVTGKDGEDYPVTAFPGVTLRGEIFSPFPAGSETEASARACLAPDAVFFAAGEWFAFLPDGGEPIPIPAGTSPASRLPTPKSIAPVGYEAVFDGWDLDGDGAADPLPETMTEELHGTPVFTITEKGPTDPTPVSWRIEEPYLRALAPETEVSALAEALGGEYASASFVSPTGKTLTGAEYVPTGAAVTLTGKDGGRLSLTALVTGDLNGDGKVTLTDFTQFRLLLLSPDPAAPLKTAAADLNGDAKATLTDFLLLRSHLLGASAITPR